MLASAITCDETVTNSFDLLQVRLLWPGTDIVSTEAAPRREQTSELDRIPEERERPTWEWLNGFDSG